jgi:hypothetical protein
LIVGEHAAPAARQFCGRDEHARTFHRAAVVGRDHPPGDAAGRRRRRVLRLRGRVARRLLTAGRRPRRLRDLSRRLLSGRRHAQHEQETHDREGADHLTLLDPKPVAMVY